MKAMTEKIAIELDKIMSQSADKLEITEAVAHAPYFALEKVKATVEKLAAKIDFMEGGFEPLEQLLNVESMKAMTEKIAIELDKIMSQLADKLEITEAVAHAPYFALEKVKATVEKLAAKIDFMEGGFEPLEQLLNVESMKAMTEKIAIELDKIMSQLADKLEITEAVAHAPYFALEKVKATVEKLAAKIDSVLNTGTQRPLSPLDGGVPAESAVVEDDGLPSWVKALREAEKAWHGNLTMIMEGRFEEPNPKSFSTSFQEYIISLIEISSEIVLPAATKLLEARNAVDAPELRNNNHAVPAAADMVKAHTTTTADIPKPVASAEHKPKSVSTPFGGYIASLTKVSAAVVVPATAKGLEAHHAVDASEPRTDNHDMPAVADLVKAHATTIADIPKPVVLAKLKPKSASTPFGGYIGSLTKASSEVVVPAAPNSETKEKEKAPEEIHPATGKMTPQLEEKTEELDTVGTMERMRRNIPVEGQAGGLGVALSWDAFVEIEENWSKVKTSKPFTSYSQLLRKHQNGIPPPPQFVTQDGAFGSPRCWAKLQESQNKKLDYDIVVIGGTLGVFFATALQLKGHRVCVLETGKLQDRGQEWNISMDELLELMKLGVLTQEDVDEAIMTEFRAGFENREVTPTNGEYFANGAGSECEIPDVLNLGVAPGVLLERVAARFKELGGVIKEETRIKGVVVSEMIGTAMDLGAENEPVTAWLVLNCMGNGSPIYLQQR
jgi:hypothetical protein